MVMNQLLFNYNIPLLRNFEVNYLRDLFDDFNPEVNKLIREVTGETNSWARYNQVLNKLIREGYDDSELEQTLFLQLAYEKTDHSYIFNLNSEISVEEFFDTHNNITLNNRKLTDIRNAESNLLTVRRIDNEVIFLFRFGSVNEESNKPVSLFIPCIFDFTNNLLHIKMRKGYISKSEYRSKDLIELILEKINNEPTYPITISKYNSASLKKVLYNIFSFEAKKAEALINERVTTITEERLNEVIQNFLSRDLDIDITPSYIDRVKSIFYQSNSIEMDDNEFYGGYIFAFTFLDGAMTKSLTRSSDREPVFNKKVYWNLKDIIHEEKEITEISLYWRFNENNFSQAPNGDNFSFVEVSLKEKKGMLEIHFYQSEEDRREKSEFVIYRVKEYLQQEGLS